MAKLVRKKQPEDASDVVLRKRDDRRLVFVTGDDILAMLQEILTALTERGDQQLAQHVMHQISDLKCR